MDQGEVKKALGDLPLGDLRYFARIDSTNNEAVHWADQGAPDLSLVVADEQTAGRGREGRHWFTPPAASLAFSLVMKTFESAGNLETSQILSRLTGLGALAVSEALSSDFGLTAEIKWPNDVLLERRKIAGVLAEAHWIGEHLSAVVLGIGINVAPGSVPPDGKVIFPASCVETVLGRPVERLELLRAILTHLLAWREKMGQASYLQAWEQRLAFRNEWVNIVTGQETQSDTVQIIGLDVHGGLIVKDQSGKSLVLHMGEVRLKIGD
jgi:BirA family transcriptional regulator, biotin operon repressor / biotin---[acetyl-CoA-carboxylase] ligase